MEVASKLLEIERKKGGRKGQNSKKEKRKVEALVSSLLAVDFLKPAGGIEASIRSLYLYGWAYVQTSSLLPLLLL